MALFILVRTKEQQRIASFIIPLLFLNGAIALELSFKILFSKARQYWGNYHMAVICLLSILLLTSGVSIPNNTYGKIFNQKKIISSAEPFYPDYKTTSQFVNENGKGKNIFISGSSVASYFGYLKLLDKNSLFGVQSYKGSIIEIDKMYYDQYTNIRVLNTREEMVDKLKERDVYFIMSYSSFPTEINVLGKISKFSHLSSDIRNLIEGKCDLIYSGLDLVSKVYFCDSKKLQ